MSDKISLYERMGGRPTLEKVHKIFYDKIYKHPWIGQFFKEIDQTHIENQQTDFMADAMGGPSNFFGKMPVEAHKHMFITEELFDLRTKLLEESLIEAQVSEENRASWLKIDSAFKRALVKKTTSECERRYPMEPIQDFPDPIKKAS